MITIKIYDGASPTTLLATMSQSRDRQFLHQLNEVGSGQMRVHKRDAQLATRKDALHYANIVRFAIDGTDRFAMIIESRNYSPAPPGELGEQYWDVSGRGVLALLEDAIVYPETGIAGSHARQRFFNWTAIAYDDSGWTAAVQIQRQDAAGVYTGHPSGFPDAEAYWIWSRAMSGGNAPDGRSYFRKTFNVASDTPVAIFSACDNSHRVYLDGEPVLDDGERGGTGWLEAIHYNTILSAGDHELAVEGINYDYVAGGDSPAAFILTVMEVDETTGELLRPLNSLEHTDSSWVALDYPAEVPGMSIGQIWSLLISEAQTRGALPGVTHTFTDSLDSNMNAWSPATIDIAVDIGTSLLDVARTLIEQFIDVEMTPTLVFNVDNKGTLGQDLTGSVNLRVGVHFEELSEAGQDHQTNVVLARDTTGLLTEQDFLPSPGHVTGKRRETYLELALATSESRAQDMSTQIMEEYAFPTIQVSGRVRASSGVYTTWQPGDIIKMPDPLEVATETTVMSIAVEEDEAGHESYWVEGMQDDQVDFEVSS